VEADPERSRAVPDARGGALHGGHEAWRGAHAQAFSLYSQRTWDEALRQLGGMPVVDPKDAEKIEAMRAIAAQSGNGRGFFARNGSGFGARK
jgi:hypothetical protein